MDLLPKDEETEQQSHCEQVQQRQPEISAAQDGVRQEDLGLKAIPSVTEIPSASSNKHTKDIKTLKKKRNWGLLLQGVTNFLHHLQQPLQTCQVRPLVLSFGN